MTINEIAELIGGEITGEDSWKIVGINSLELSVPGEISFFFDTRFRDQVKTTKASALLVLKVSDLFEGPQVVVANPELAYAKLAARFARPGPRFPGRSEEAVIHESAKLGKNVSVYPLVYIGKDAVIGNNVTLFPGVFVGDRVRVGDKTLVYPNVSIMHDCLIGNEVIIHAGCVIGSDGFGFVRDGSVNVKIPQMGTVQIDDQVELGANNTVDRATMGKTWIKRGVKTDNGVQVAHNVVIGEDTIIVAQAALAGSVQIGNQVVIGGQVGISDHVRVGDNAMIGSKSGVPKSLAKGAVVSGTPAMPHRLWLKTSRLIARLPQFSERLRSLEKKLEKLEGRLGNKGK